MPGLSEDDFHKGAQQGREDGISAIRKTSGILDETVLLRDFSQLMANMGAPILTGIDQASYHIGILSGRQQAIIVITSVLESTQEPRGLALELKFVAAINARPYPPIPKIPDQFAH